MSVIQNRSAFVRRVSARGNLSEAAAEDIADALDADLQDAATKLDLARVETRIAELRTVIERNFNRALVIQLAMLGALFAALRLT